MISISSLLPTKNLSSPRSHASRRRYKTPDTDDTDGGDPVDTNLVPLSGGDDVSTGNYTPVTSRTTSPISLLPLVHDDLSSHTVVRYRYGNVRPPESFSSDQERTTNHLQGRRRSIGRVIFWSSGICFHQHWTTRRKKRKGTGGKWGGRTMLTTMISFRC